MVLKGEKKKKKKRLLLEGATKKSPKKSCIASTSSLFYSTRRAQSPMSANIAMRSKRTSNTTMEVIPPIKMVVDPMSTAHGRLKGKASQNKPICQLNGKSGRVVQRWYHHFDISFTGVNFSQKNP